MNQTENGWWTAEFQIKHLNKDDPPQGYMDLVIVHKVLFPIITQEEKYLKYGLWRLHRTPPTADGHVSKFSFYSPPEVANRIFRAIENNEIFKKLSGTYFSYHPTRPEDPKTRPRPCVEDNSDPSSGWPPEIRKTWPYYINGVSKMWVRLIDEISRNIPKGEASADLDHYREVDNEISRMLREKGRHAFLHHLSALFGYKEIDITFPVLFPGHIQVAVDSNGKATQVFAKF